MSVIKPILRIFDERKAKEFYIDWLGFKVDWEHRFGDNLPLYMQVSFRDIVLHLSEHHGDCNPGARIHIEEFENLKDYHKLLIDKDYRYNKPCISKAFWDKNVYTMEVIDPFGNKLTLNGK